MTKYRWDGRQWVDKATGEAMEAPDRLGVPMVRSDIEPYWSVASNKLIDGRSDQREDLKRAGCRLADPSEAPQVCRTEKWARKLGMDREDLSAKRMKDAGTAAI